MKRSERLRRLNRNVISFKVGFKMLGADLVPAPMMPRFNSENADSTVLVVMHAPFSYADIFTGLMIDCLMLGIAYGVLVSWEDRQ